MKQTIFVDMDDTSFDFGNSPVFEGIEIDDTRMYEPGFFRDLKPIPGALCAIRKLLKMGYDVQLLTQPVANSAHSYSEKVQCVGMWLPELVDKINMVQDKGLVRGAWLIDDNAKKWKAKFEAHPGQMFIHFEYDRHNPEKNRQNWEAIVEFFHGIATIGVGRLP